jgi:CheY-like chemotaxis protein
MTILYADDDHDDCDILRDALNQIDPSINCHFASNGIEALDMLDHAQVLPDYIFLDINMPLMNGTKCLSELKKNQRLRDIPVIVYSTTITDEVRLELYNLGANSVLEKPNDIHELESILAGVIAPIVLGKQ